MPSEHETHKTPRWKVQDVAKQTLLGKSWRQPAGALQSLIETPDNIAMAFAAATISGASGTVLLQERAIRALQSAVTGIVCVVGHTGVRGASPAFALLTAKHLPSPVLDTWSQVAAAQARRLLSLRVRLEDRARAGSWFRVTGRALDVRVRLLPEGAAELLFQSARYVTQHATVVAGHPRPSLPSCWSPPPAQAHSFWQSVALADLLARQMDATVARSDGSKLLQHLVACGAHDWTRALPPSFVRFAPLQEADVIGWQPGALGPADIVEIEIGGNLHRALHRSEIVLGKCRAAGVPLPRVRIVADEARRDTFHLRLRRHPNLRSLVAFQSTAELALGLGRQLLF